MDILGALIFWTMMIGTSVRAWKYVFLDHELMHIMEHVRQGATKGGIEFSFYRLKLIDGISVPIPTMKCWGNYTANKDKVALAGGLYSGIQSLFIGACGWYSGLLWLEFPFVTLGVLNIVYGIYERLFLGKINFDTYMRWHYVVYGITIATMIILYLMREIW